MHEQIANRLAHQKASMIDRHLAIFLTENGFKTDEWSVGAIKKELKEKGFEVTVEITKYSESEVYIFKLCKVYAQTTLGIPNPTINITEWPQHQKD